MRSHPSERFVAPSGIETGTPLKLLFDSNLVALIAESFQTVYAKFESELFMIQACQGLNDLEMKDRARHIAQALANQLPTDFPQASKILISSLGPKLKATYENGLAPFFYMAHSEFIAQYGNGDFESALRANYELTQRFTAEFCIRPLIDQHLEKALERLDTWTQDSNPHVRRLVSEGTRPLLPWAMRLKKIQNNPNLTLPLLEKLKDDPELYVRRSVANHLGDHTKAKLDLVLKTCERWLEESKVMSDPIKAKERRWTIRHAIRYPAKKGHAEALKLRAAAK